jgi:glycosyltransferase
MKFSVVTVCLNSAKTINKTIESVNSQTYHNIEHVFVDGLSTDDTVNVINKTSIRDKKIISESDVGIYDAMNKGFFISTGDIVAFLNSDDFYVDGNVVEDIINLFKSGSHDYVYGDIQMIDQNGVVRRHWKVGASCEKYLNGLQIPHPSFFVRKSVLNKMDLPFDPKYKIASDIKQQLLLINKYGCRGRYLPRVLVGMALGGTSTSGVKAYIKGWGETRKAYNDLFGKGGVYFVVKKVLSKIKGVKV